MYAKFIERASFREEKGRWTYNVEKERKFSIYEIELKKKLFFMHYSSYKWEWREVGQNYMGKECRNLFVAKKVAWSIVANHHILLTTTTKRTGPPSKKRKSIFLLLNHNYIELPLLFFLGHQWVLDCWEVAKQFAKWNLLLLRDICNSFNT